MLAWLHGAALLPDLHRHLDGSLRHDTFVALAQRLGVPLEGNLRFSQGMGLDEALSRFATTLSVLQTTEAVARVAHEMCEDAKADGVSTLEVRFAPQLHHGAPIDQVVDAALDGLSGRAGLILCGLYGEPIELLLRLVEVARTRPGVVGLDLAGGPAPNHKLVLRDYAPAFCMARKYGLGRTVHAGEGRPAMEIRAAIEALHAQRIGHGTTLLDCPETVELVLRHGVTIEACPTSNVHTGAIRALDEHPLPQWLKLGIKACINTDNTLLSDVTSSVEHRRVRGIPGMTDALLDQAIAHGHHAAFTIL